MMPVLESGVDANLSDNQLNWVADIILMRYERR